MIRVAVAGAGAIGRTHIQLLGLSPTCELCAVVDPAHAAREVAEKEGVPLHSSLADLFAKDRPDAVIIATPNQLHVEHALACLAAGVPMLLEKPIASTVAEAQRLLDAAEGKGTPILVGHHRAHSPILAKAKELIEGGALGRLVAVMGSAVFYKPDAYFDEAPWRRETGGGPILINLIHEVHSLRMLCGEIVAVQAFASRALRGFPVEDTAAINLRFANGALGTFMLSDTAASGRSWEQTSRENSAYAHSADEDCYVIAGTRGSLSVPTLRLKTYPSDEDRSWFMPFDARVADADREDPLKRQLEHFGSLVRGEAVPLVSARDGLQNLRVTAAIAEAAATGSAVELAH